MGLMAETIANAAITAAVAVLNGGTGEFRESDETEVATVTFSNPAQDGAASGGVATFDTITKDDACTGGGPIDHLTLITSGASDQVELSVGLADPGTAEVIMDNLSPTAGVDVYLTLDLAFPVDLA